MRLDDRRRAKGKKEWSLQGERDTVRMPKGISMGQGTWYTPSPWAKSSYPWTEAVEIPKQTQYITLPISTTIRSQCGLTLTQMRSKDFKGYPLGSWVRSTTFLWAVLRRANVNSCSFLRQVINTCPCLSNTYEQPAYWGISVWEINMRQFCLFLISAFPL